MTLKSEFTTGFKRLYYPTWVNKRSSVKSNETRWNR